MKSDGVLAGSICVDHCHVQPSKAAQRKLIERLTADYDGPIIRSKAGQRVQVVCPACKAKRIVSSLAFTIACGAARK